MDEFLKKIESQLVEYSVLPVEYKKLLDDMILSNAKRIRPRLAYLVVRACGENVSNEQIKLISAGEILHTASLIHDDIIDNSDIRRGIETINKKFDSKLAVVTGDLLAAEGLKKILALKNIEILNLFQNTFKDMCESEIYQYFTRGEIPNFENYLDKTSKKTGALFAAILEGTAILSQRLNRKLLRDIGLAFGIAFQIRNDLNAYEDNNNQDRLNKIYTAPDIFYSEYKDFQISIEKTNDLIDNEVRKVLDIIKDFPSNEYKEELIRMVKESLCKRTK